MRSNSLYPVQAASPEKRAVQLRDQFPSSASASPKKRTSFPVKTSLRSDSVYPVQAASLEKRAVRLRNQFFDEMRKQLYTEDEDRAFYADIQTALKLQEARLESGEVICAHLEQRLLNVSCDDPGSTVGMVLVLPLLQDKLDVLAANHAAEMAARAEQDLIRLHVRP